MHRLAFGELILKPEVSQRSHIYSSQSQQRGGGRGPRVSGAFTRARSDGERWIFKGPFSAWAWCLHRRHLTSVQDPPREVYCSSSFISQVRTLTPDKVMCLPTLYMPCDMGTAWTWAQVRRLLMPHFPHHPGQWEMWMGWCVEHITCLSVDAHTHWAVAFLLVDGSGLFVLWVTEEAIDLCEITVRRE